MLGRENEIRSSVTYVLTECTGIVRGKRNEISAPHGHFLKKIEKQAKFEPK